MIRVDIFIYAIILFILIFLVSKRSILIGIFFVVIGTVLNLVIIDSDISSWIQKAQMDKMNIHNDVMFRLDRCSPNLNLELCRIFYNKPVVFLSNLFIRIIGQFSEENLLSITQMPFRSIFVLFCYLGILKLLMEKHSRVKSVLISWLVIYGILGIFGGYNTAISLSAFFLLVFLSGSGFLLLIKSVQSIYEHTKV